jgi:hypothetical protein
MECYIEENHLNQPPAKHPKITFMLNGNNWPSVQKTFNEFCAARSIKQLTVSTHHIVLRAVKGPLPLLTLSDGQTTQDEAKQGQFTFVSIYIFTGMYISF